MCTEGSAVLPSHGMCASSREAVFGQQDKPNKNACMFQVVIRGMAAAECLPCNLNVI